MTVAVARSLSTNARNVRPSPDAAQPSRGAAAWPIEPANCSSAGPTEESAVK